jgi:hypothetical protein
MMVNANVHICIDIQYLYHGKGTGCRFHQGNKICTMKHDRVKYRLIDKFRTKYQIKCLKMNLKTIFTRHTYLNKKNYISCLDIL